MGRRLRRDPQRRSRGGRDRVPRHRHRGAVGGLRRDPRRLERRPRRRVPLPRPAAGDPHAAARAAVARLPAADLGRRATSSPRRGEVLRRYAPGVTFTEIENPARFRCHSRVAARYRSGRVLLAGDAAHACTPAEGHGMNTGLQDAFNLGWKLALVCRGEAGAGLLDTYETERRPVAERVVASGADVEAAQAMTDAGERAPNATPSIRRTFADPDIAHHEAAAASEIDRSYPRSRAVAGDDGAGLAPGGLLPDTPPVEPAEAIRAAARAHPPPGPHADRPRRSAGRSGPGRRAGRGARGARPVRRSTRSSACARGRVVGPVGRIDERSPRSSASSTSRCSRSARTATSACATTAATRRGRGLPRRARGVAPCPGFPPEGTCELAWGSDGEALNPLEAARDRRHLPRGLPQRVRRVGREQDVARLPDTGAQLSRRSGLRASADLGRRTRPCRGPRPLP